MGWGGGGRRQARQASCQNLWVTIKSYAAILQNFPFMVPASCVPSGDTWMLPCGTVSPLQWHWASSLMGMDRAGKMPHYFKSQLLTLVVFLSSFCTEVTELPPRTRAPFLLKGRKGTAKAIICGLCLVSHLEKLPTAECSAGPLWAWLSTPAWMLILQGEWNPQLGLFTWVLSSLHSHTAQEESGSRRILCLVSAQACCRQFFFSFLKLLCMFSVVCHHIFPFLLFLILYKRPHRFSALVHIYGCGSFKRGWDVTNMQS